MMVMMMMMKVSEIDNWKVGQKKQIVDDQISGDLREDKVEYNTSQVNCICASEPKCISASAVQKNVHVTQFVCYVETLTNCTRRQSKKTW